MELIDFIKSLNLPSDAYCVVGGALMHHLGLRGLGTHDIDLLVTPVLYDILKMHPDWEVKKSGSSKHKKNPTYKTQYTYTADKLTNLDISVPVEVLNENDFVYKLPEIKTYISRAFKVDGIPFIMALDMLQWKAKVCNHRPKDREDIGLLVDYIIDNP